VSKLSALSSGRIYFPDDITGTQFCQRLNRPQGQSAVGTIKSINISMTHRESNPHTSSSQRSSSNNLESLQFDNLFCKHFNICVLAELFHIYDITSYFFVAYVPEDGRKMPKHVGDLPHVCILLYLIILQLLDCIW